MSQLTTIGLDIAKNVFHAHGADERAEVLFSKKMRRTKLLDFFAEQPRCVVALEACGGAHHWGRELAQIGHEVRLVPPAYVKPFVKRHKNDALDAEDMRRSETLSTTDLIQIQACRINGCPNPDIPSDMGRPFPQVCC